MNYPILITILIFLLCFGRFIWIITHERRSLRAGVSLVITLFSFLFLGVVILVNIADLDPHYGSEQGGKRPVIIIQNDVGNKFAPTVIVAAVTSRISKKPNQPTHVLIDKNPAFSRPSVVLLEQIFTIDKERINNFMGLTSEWEMKQIEEALLKSLGINK